MLNGIKSYLIYVSLLYCYNIYKVTALIKESKYGLSKYNCTENIIPTYRGLKPMIKLIYEQTLNTVHGKKLELKNKN